MPRKKPLKKQTKPDKHSTAVVEKATQTLLSAVEEECRTADQQYSKEAFLDLFEPCNNNQLLGEQVTSGNEQRLLLLNAIECFQKGHATRFFSGLQSLVTFVIQNDEYIPESVQQNNNNEEEEAVVVADEPSSRALVFLRHSAVCVLTYLMEQVAQQKLKEKEKNQSSTATATVQKQYELLEEAYEVASALHDITMSLSDCGEEGLVTQRAIMKLCEAAWHNNFKYREELIVQPLPLLVQSALADTSPKSELSRLFKIRHAVAHMDFSDPSSDWLRSVLMRVASSPACLKIPEGLRFSAYLFQADLLLIPSLHQAMKAQIPNEKKIVLEAYAEIYYRAWKEVPEDDEVGIREEIENTVLSDLVYALLHVAKPSMFKALLTVLQVFHENKRKPDVEDLLHRLYGPTLWRSLSAANARVRANATQVLAQVFPLVQSTHTQTAKQVEKCCTALRELLQDKDSLVRVQASAATAQVLAGYWDALPPNEIRSLLESLMSHASDTTSPSVRCAALDATTKLLQAPPAQAVLKTLLPSLRNLVHDRVEKVRLSMVCLLNQVKETPGIKYFDIVPIVDLNARLGSERIDGPVALALSGLMLNSLLPQGKDVRPKDQIKRTLKFLEKEPHAATVFYSNLAHHCPVQVIAKLIGWLFKCLHKAVENDDSDEPVKSTKRGATSNPPKGKRKRGRAQKQEEEDTENQQPNLAGFKTPLLSAVNMELVAQVAETICILWQSIESSLRSKTNDEWRQHLLDTFSGSNITSVIQYADNLATSQSDETTQESYYRLRDAMLRCAARLPPNKIEGLQKYMALSFENAQEGPTFHTDGASVLGFVALFCLWGMEKEMADSLAKSISDFFDSESPQFFDLLSPSQADKARGKARRKGSTGKPTIPHLPPKLAMEAVATIMEDSRSMFVDSRQALLENAETRSVVFNAMLKGVSYMVQMRETGNELSDANMEFILRCCELCGKLVLHTSQLKQADPEHGDENEPRDIRAWAVEFIKNASVEATPPQNPLFQDPDISRISLPSASPRIQGRRSTRLSGKIIGRDDVEKAKVLAHFLDAQLISTLTFLTESMNISKNQAPEIREGVLAWCKHLDARQQPITLLPFFLRLAVTTSQIDSNFDLWKPLWVAFQNVEESEELFEEALMLLHLNRIGVDTTVLRSCAQAFSSAICEATAASSLGESSDASLPDSIGDFWPSGSIAQSLEILLQSKGWRMAMIQIVIRSIKENQSSGPEVLGKIVAMNLRLLWLLFDAKPSQEARDVICNEITVEMFETDSGAHRIAFELLEAVQE